MWRGDAISVLKVSSIVAKGREAARSVRQASSATSAVVRAASSVHKGSTLAMNARWNVSPVLSARSAPSEAPVSAPPVHLTRGPWNLGLLWRQIVSATKDTLEMTQPNLAPYAKKTLCAMDRLTNLSFKQYPDSTYEISSSTNVCPIDAKEVRGKISATLDSQEKCVEDVSWVIFILEVQAALNVILEIKVLLGLFLLSSYYC